MLLSKHRDLCAPGTNCPRFQPQIVRVPTNHLNGRDANINEALGVSNTDFDSGCFLSDSHRFANKNKRGTLEYANFMFAIYHKVMMAD